MPTHSLRFGELIDLIDRLPLDERESLVEVVRRRNDDEQRERLAASSRAAKREHRRGKTRAATAEEIMREILD